MKNQSNSEFHPNFSHANLAEAYASTEDGQIYSLAMEDDIHTSMLSAHDQVHKQISSLEFWANFLPSDDHDRAQVIRDLDYRERMATKIGAYLESVGLLEPFD